MDEADKTTLGKSCRISSLHYDDVYRRGLKVKVQNLVAVWTVMENLQYQYSVEIQEPISFDLRKHKFLS